MQTNLFDQKWNDIWKIDLNDSIFWLEMNETLVHRALVYFLSNSRLNVAHTKTRWERKGSTRKIYRQKWTWRARMWSNRSPIRKKWWVVFGPRNNQNFSIQMNRKERRKALFCVLSSKLSNKQLLVLDKVELGTIKTKSMVEVFSGLPYEKNILFVIPEKNEVLEKSSSNISYVKTLDVKYLNVHDLIKYNTLILLKDSLDFLNTL